MKNIFTIACFCAPLFTAPLAIADTTVTNQTMAAKSIEAADQTGKQKLNELINSPDTYNNVLKVLLEPQFGKTNKLMGLISDLNIKFKAFDATKTGDKVGLGFEYSYDKSFAGAVIKTNADSPMDLSLSFHAKGNVAFDKNKNPNDFLDTGLKFELFQSIGGVDPRIYKKDAFAANRQAQYNASTITNQVREEIDADPRWKEWQDIVKRALINQFFYDVAGNVSLESNQTFSKKQWAYGLQVGGVVRAWNDDAPLARFNLLDYPFAGLRYLTGADREWKPSGQAIPSVIAGIDLVDPLDKTTRLAV